MQVEGVVVGSRKAGTTWLYSNFLIDPDVSVSRIVKESRFFLGAMDEEAYHALFASPSGTMLEVDSALCYDDRAPVRMLAYRPEMRVVLVLREPIAFAVSRYVHARRKGELQASSIREAIARDDLFRSELDYARMIERFSVHGLELKVVGFERLETQPTEFYCEVKAHLTKGRGDWQPTVVERENVARTSRVPWVSRTLSAAAKKARSKGWHRVVNAAKRTGVKRVLDRPLGSGDKQELYREAAPVVRAEYPEAVRIHGDLR